MKKKKLLVLIIGVAIIASLAFAVFSIQGTEAGVTDVKRGNIKKYVEEIGTVKCEEQKTVSIEGSGLIEAVTAEVGQQVSKGELLLSMEKKQLEIQLRNVDEKIKEIKATFEGSEVKNYAGNLEKAKIAFEQAEDAYMLAQDDFNKSKALAEAGAVSKDELRLKDSAVKNAKALINRAEIDLQQIEVNTPESVKAVYRAQLEQVVLSRESIVHSLEKQDVRAPIDGVVLERKVEANMLGVPGTDAFVIGNTGELEIEAYILADDVSNIKLGDEVEITERSQEKQTMGGKVAKIAPSAVAVTSSLGVNQKKVAVTIEAARQSELLRPGYEVDVKVITERKNGVVIVPLSSVFEYEGKDHVFVIADGKTVLRAVQTGIEDAASVEIIEGLKEGELVLSEPDINTKEGMKIKPAKNEK